LVGKFVGLLVGCWVVGFVVASGVAAIVGAGVLALLCNAVIRSLPVLVPLLASTRDVSKFFNKSTSLAANVFSTIAMVIAAVSLIVTRTFMSGAMRTVMVSLVTPLNDCSRAVFNFVFTSPFATGVKALKSRPSIVKPNLNTGGVVVPGVGLAVGRLVGSLVGERVGVAVGSSVGLSVGDFVGSRVGFFVGLFVGGGGFEPHGALPPPIGSSSTTGGASVGSSVGSSVGLSVGLLVGKYVGTMVGAVVGVVVGVIVGDSVGFIVVVGFCPQGVSV
jgi:hypothetical protein